MRRCTVLTLPNSRIRLALQRTSKPQVIARTIASLPGRPASTNMRETNGRNAEQKSSGVVGHVRNVNRNDIRPSQSARKTTLECNFVAVSVSQIIRTHDFGPGSAPESLGTTPARPRILAPLSHNVAECALIMSRCVGYARESLHRVRIRRSAADGCLHCRVHDFPTSVFVAGGRDQAVTLTLVLTRFKCEGDEEETHRAFRSY